MSHPEQKQFFERVREKYPRQFTGVKSIDCGSLDVNGSLRMLFNDSWYRGVDIVPGKNVNIVSAIKDLDIDDIDTVVSGEMLEHDETWAESLQKMYDITKSGGLIAISCAGKGRKEHGTARTTGERKLWGTSPNYYRNLTEEDFRTVYKDNMFTEMYFEYNPVSCDQYFYGIKV